MARNWQWGSQIANKEKLSNGDVGPKGLFSQLFYGKLGTWSKCLEIQDCWKIRYGPPLCWGVGHKVHLVSGSSVKILLTILT